MSGDTDAFRGKATPAVWTRGRPVLARDLRAIATNTTKVFAGSTRQADDELPPTVALYEVTEVLADDFVKVKSVLHTGDLVDEIVARQIADDALGVGDRVIPLTGYRRKQTMGLGCIVQNGCCFRSRNLCLVLMQ